MGHATPLLRRITLLFSLATVAAVPVSGSVTVDRQEGHFVFTAAWPEKSAAGRKSRTIVPLDSRLGDTSGLIGSLFITVDWWTLFGEPVENYIVEWTASGRFQVKDSTGATVTVTREEVERYPDLKLRFAQLKPKAMDFTVWYRLDYSGVLSAANRATLDKRYQALRRSGDTLYDAERLVKNNQFLITGSGAMPLSAPGSHSWQDFISSYVSTSYDVTRSIAHQKPLIAETLKRARSLEIMNVRVVRLELPEPEMRTIADKLRRYREGQTDPTPLEQIAAAQKQEVPAYAAKDEWAEAATKPGPPPVPIPKKATDGKYYYHHESGEKAFPQGFLGASAFRGGIAWVNSGNVAWVTPASGHPDKAKYGESKEHYVNYIDESGRVIFPQKYTNITDCQLSADGKEHLFVLTAGNPDRRKWRSGVYDLVSKSWVINEANQIIGSGSPNADGTRIFRVETIRSLSEPYRGYDPGYDPYPQITNMVCDAQIDFKAYSWNPKTRQMTLERESSYKKTASIRYWFSKPDQIQPRAR